MTGTLITAAVWAVGIGATGWCAWHCLRGIRSMHQGRATTCCPPGASGADRTAEQLAQLRHELAELKTARGSDTDRSGTVTSAR